MRKKITKTKGAVARKTFKIKGVHSPIFIE